MTTVVHPDLTPLLVQAVEEAVVAVEEAVAEVVAVEDKNPKNFIKKYQLSTKRK
jgi:hypothetical protein